MKYQYVSVVAVSTVYSILVAFVNSEFFTSIAELEKLLHTEGEIVNTLKNYVKVEEERLEKVKRLSNHYEKVHNLAEKDVESFLTNPLNAFLLVKRLTTDWKAAHRLFDGSEARAVIQNKTLKDLNFPSNEDLTGAAAALVRLQEIYLLDTETIAKGLVKGSRPTSELSAGDCYELGKKAYEVRKFQHCLEWMEETMRKLKKEKAEYPKVTAILEYMAFASWVLKNYTFAVEVTEHLIELQPDHPRAYENLFYYKNLEAIEEAKKRANGSEDLENILQEFVTPTPIKFIERELPSHVHESYEKLCRGESLKTPKEESLLTCYLSKRNNYFLLQPVKVEVLSLKPRIVIYHDVFDDKEANVIKNLALPKLARATVANETSGKLDVSQDRISKSAWLNDYEDQLIPRINKRIEAITGLDSENSEALHVINYGIGGHYEPHCDFAKPGGKVHKFGRWGNRIATWIAYLSDVPAGGSTVFPRIGVEVKPRKGSAAFWYNLYRNGTGDDNTMHAACPVLAGSKWVSNKWLHELGNEFKRPCSLDILK